MQLSFWYKNPAGGDFSVYISTDGGVTHETALATGLTGVMSWAEHPAISLAGYAGQEVVIVFKGTSNWGYGDAYIYLDDVTVMEVPSCMKPYDLEVTATTTTSATFSWTNGAADQTAWQICLNGDETNLIMAESNPFTVEDLNHSTAYTAKVRAYCSADDQSDWSAAMSFATACEAITTFPWMVDFESFNVNTVPNCWDNSASTTTTVSGEYPERVWGVYSNDRNKMIRMHNYFVESGTALINTPDLVLPADAECNLTFDYSHRASCGAFKVKISTDGGTTFTDLKSYTKTYDLYDQTDPGTFTSAEPISLAAYTGQTVILQFYAESDYEYGAIFVDNVRVGAPVITFTKEITAHNGTAGWYLIASSIGDVYATDVANLANIDDDEGFDLYRFNEAAELEWENWKSHTNDDDHYHFNLEADRGYLYANANDVTLTFTGTPYTGSGEVTLNKSSNSQGWNLVGNPYTESAYIDRDFYVMNEDRDEIVTSGERNYIEPMEGVFVQAENDEEQLVFSTTPANSTGNKGALSINVTKASHNRSGNSLIDRAVVRFGEGNTLSKFQLNPNHTKVYIPQDGKDYAIVNAEAAGEMPLNFMAGNDGTYTLSFNAKEVTFGYLHLIDNMTGVETNLLETSSYTFDARTTDYESRFKLVFATGSNNDSDNFAFFSNGNIIVNGEGTLQMIDMTGRVIVQGDAINRVSTDGMTAGVYVLRLINGDNIKVQKIVVR